MYMRFFAVPVYGDGVTGYPIIKEATFTHEELVGWVANPKITPDHKRAPLICFTGLQPGRDGCYENGIPKRKTGNVEAVYAFLIDYDSGSKLDVIHNKLVELNVRHYLYTSYSHGDERKGTDDRFRVLLPLAIPVPGVWWREPSHVSAQDSLRRIFAFGLEEPDPVSFRSVHGHRAPICHPDREHLYQWRAHEGLPLNVMSLFEGNHAKWMQQQASKPIQVTGESLELYIDDTHYPQWDSTANFKRAVAERTRAKLDALPWGGRGGGVVHDSLLKAIANLRHCEFSWAEIEDLLYPYESLAHPGEIRNMLRSMS